jgi:alpha-1,6-mannosyltransferase
MSSSAGEGKERASRIAGRSVLLIGVASGLLYLAVVAIQTRIHAPASPDGASGSSAYAVFVIATLSLFALYGGLLFICARGHLVSKRAGVIAFAFPVVFNVLLILAPPRLSIDLLSYVSHGYISSVLEGNALVQPSSIVAETPLGPELARLGWRPVHPASPYGPFWTRVEAATLDVTSRVPPAMTLLKVLVTAASLASASLIWRILGFVRPERQVLGTLAYLWNPVIVIEIAGEGHNDSVMVFFVLLALLLAIEGRGAGSLVAMCLGVLTKYLPLFLLPLQIVFLWRRRRSTRWFAKEAIIGLVVSAVVTVILFVGMWAGIDTWNGVRASAHVGSTGSTPTMIARVLSEFWSSPRLETITGFLLLALFVGYVGKVQASVASATSLLRACAAVSVTYVLLASPAYWPWYVVMPVALLTLVPNASAVLLLVSMSSGARLVAPLDMLYVHGVIERRIYFVVTWILGLGLPATTAIILHAKGRWSLLTPTQAPPNHRRGGKPSVPGVTGAVG